MIDKRYLVSVDLSSLNQGVVVSNASVSETQVAATTFLTGPRGADGTTGSDGVGVPAGGTINQYLKKNSSTDYDTGWDSLDKTDVGLSNVDNTSDASKPVSTLTQTALNAKEPTVTAGTTAQYYRGDKTFQTLNQDAVPDGTTNKAYTATEKTKLAAITGTNTGDQTITLTGDVTGSGTGSFATTIAAGVIVNADVNTSAAVALTKLAATTASRALVSDVSGFITPATTTSTEIGYVNGVTSAIQTQLNAKQATGNYITALTGDITATGPGSVASTLATVNSNVGTFGTATQVPTYTVNAKGLITASANTSIQIAESQVTNLVSDLAAKQGTITLTTTGTSGAATLIANTLNIPNYAGGGGSAGITRSVVVTSGNVTAGATTLVDYVYIISAAHTVTLPTAVGNTNRYTLKNRHTSSVALAFTSGQTADGGGITLAPNASVDLISDNTNWVIT